MLCCGLIAVTLLLHSVIAAIAERPSCGLIAVTLLLHLGKRIGEVTLELWVDCGHPLATLLRFTLYRDTSCGLIAVTLLLH